MHTYTVNHNLQGDNTQPMVTESKMFLRKGLVTRNTHVIYQSYGNHISKVIYNVKAFKK